MNLCRNKLHDMEAPNAWMSNGIRGRRCRKCTYAMSQSLAGLANYRRYRIRNRIKRNAYMKEWHKRNQDKRQVSRAKENASRRACGGVANKFWQNQARNSL